MCTSSQTPCGSADSLRSGASIDQSDQSQDSGYRLGQDATQSGSGQGTQGSIRADLAQAAQGTARLLADRQSSDLPVPRQDGKQSAISNGLGLAQSIASEGEWPASVGGDGLAHLEPETRASSACPCFGSRGGPSLDGMTWVPCRMTKGTIHDKPVPFLVDNKRLGWRFRDKFLGGIERLVKSGKLEIVDMDTFKRIIASLSDQDWVVYIDAGICVPRRSRFCGPSQPKGQKNRRRRKLRYRSVQNARRRWSWSRRNIGRVGEYCSPVQTIRSGRNGWDRADVREKVAIRDISIKVNQHFRAGSIAS